ncbi:phage baseplate assembly protein V [Pontibacterium sp.]|uniref:phage baseplate assembly protein V n=1 Tax=Pontibacterium sp. TaxID=2036026 RepID=UPI0035680B7E
MSLDKILQRLEELERRLALVNVRGLIEEIDLAAVPPRVRVRYGDQQTTGWLPWKPPRSAKASVWWPPEEGEACTVISNGDLLQGEVIPGSYTNSYKAPSTNPDLFLVEFGDGSSVAHDRKEHTLDVVNIGEITVSTAAPVRVNGGSVYLNGGAGVITAESICPFTNKPHTDASDQVFAGK